MVEFFLQLSLPNFSSNICFWVPIKNWLWPNKPTETLLVSHIAVTKKSCHIIWIENSFFWGELMRTTTFLVCVMLPPSWLLCWQPHISLEGKIRTSKNVSLLGQWYIHITSQASLGKWHFAHAQHLGENDCITEAHFQALVWYVVKILSFSHSNDDDDVNFTVLRPPPLFCCKQTCKLNCNDTCTMGFLRAFCDLKRPCWVQVENNSNC